MTGGWLEAYFRPRSVAVYGASRNPEKLGHTLLANTLGMGYDGSVVAVNPAGGEILDVPAVPSLGSPVDLALVSVPGARAVEAVEDAAAAGCLVTVVLSSGFAETGAEGRRLQEQMVETAAAAGMRLVGPNCMGVVSHLEESKWLNGSYFWNVPDVPGGVSFMSQSGAFGGMFLREVHRRGLGVARFVSLGNAADVTESDVLEGLADDPDTEVIGLFVEGIRDGRRFVEAARRATARKPVIVLKGGKGGAGAKAAASHTGSIAGRHKASQAAFARAGVIEAHDTEAFFDALAAAAAGVSPPVGERARRLAVVGISGGPSVLATDAAEAAGLAMPAPSPKTETLLRDLAPSFAALGNPIDLTPQCSPAAYPPAMEAVFSDDTYDAVVVINCGLDAPEFGEGIVAGARSSGKPVTAFVMDVPGIERMLDEAGIPRFDSPERAVRPHASSGSLR